MERLKDAIKDGVPKEHVRKRFGLSEAALQKALGMKRGAGP